MSAETKVGSLIRVVPDGLSGDGQRARISFILMPDPSVSKDDPDTVDLANWPSEVAAKVRAAGAIEILATPYGTADFMDVTPVTLTSRPYGDATSDRLWRRIFSDGSSEDQVPLLYEALKQSFSNALAVPKPILTRGAAQYAPFLQELTARLALRSAGARILKRANPTQAAKADVFVGEVLRNVIVPAFFKALPSMTPGSVITNQEHVLSTIAREVVAKLTDEQVSLLASSKAGIKTDPGTGQRDTDLLELILSHVNDTAELLWSGRKSARISATKNLPDASRIFLRHQIAMGLLDAPKMAATQINSDAVNRKFNAILTQPSLAASLGLIFDFEVPFDKFKKLPKTDAFLIGGRINGLKTSAPLSTAAEISWLGSERYFGPTSKYVANASIDPATGDKQDVSLRQGFLDLRVMSAVDQDRGRYILSSLDTLSAIEKMDQKGKAAIGQIVQGQPISKDEILPELRTLGLSVLDACQDLSMRAQLEPLTYVTDKDGIDWKVLHAEEVCSGFRFDVAVVPRGTNQPVHLSLTEKIVTYNDKEPVASLEPEREDGFSRALLRQADVDLSIVAETLFVYRGDNLAVPVRTGKEKDGRRMVYDDTARHEVVTEHSAADDLAVDTLVRVPIRADSKRPLASGRPPVRFGKRIAAVNGRCRWLNGGGHTLASAQQAYIANTYALTSRILKRGQARADEEPYLHQRFEEIVAPIVLFGEQDPWVTKSDDLLKALPGTATETIILRDGTQSESRYLLPGQVSIELAEQHGVFDRLRAADRGALEAFDREASTGRFPQALGGARAKPIDYYGKDDRLPNGRYKFRETLKGGKAGKVTVTARGPVLRARVQAAPVGADIAYYADPLAECVFLVLRRGEEDAAGGPAGASPRANLVFNPRQTWPAGAIPAQIRLTRLSDADIRNGIQWRITPSIVKIAGINCPAVAISIAPGEEFDLLLWCGPANADLLKEHWLPTYIAKNGFDRASSLQASSDRTPAEDIELAGHAVFNILAGGGQAFGIKAFVDSPSITSVLNVDPIPHLNGSRTIKLCRPVETPLKMPEILNRDGAPQLQAVRIRTAKDSVPSSSGGDTQDLVEQRWQAYVDAMTGGALPPKVDPIPHWPSEENATRAYFLGRIGFDRLSTSELVCLGRWVDYVDDATMVRRDENGRWVFLPPDPKSVDATPLFKISGIKNDNVALNPLEEAEVVEDATGRRSYDFGDTRARRLLVSTLAASRFSTYFQTHESDNARRFQIGDEQQIELWIDATRRPAPLSLRQPDMFPVFKFSTEQIKAEGKAVAGFKVTMEGQCRVKINRPCIDTGEGELVALALAPFDLGKIARSANRCGIAPDNERDSLTGGQLKEYEAAIASSAERFLLRRGHDAKRISGSYDAGLEVLVPSDIGACSEDWSPTPLWLPFSPPNDANASVPELSALVSVVGFKPAVDPTSGDYWYVDLPIATGPSYWPYVRCGLIRWQPHAIDRHELSTPIEAWGNIPPTRVAEVRFIDDGHEGGDSVELVFSGIGFIEVNLGPRFPPDAGKTIRPLLNVRLVRREEGGGWAPSTDPKTGEGVFQNDIRPQMIGDEGRWIVNFQLPFKRTAMQFGLLVEEYAQMPELASAADPSVDPKLVDQLRYACVLDFMTGVAETIDQDGMSG
ncbi:hypothetical protein ACXHMN_13930 [Rhizobium sp. LEGMi12c]